MESSDEASLADSSDESADAGPSLRTTFWLLVSLAAVAAALTMLFMGMRAVMAIGGACAEGGPYVIANPCPKGIPLVMIGSIWGGLIFAGVYIWQTTKAKVASFAGFLWPALFLSLGWNFFEFAIRASRDGQGLAWGWVICGVLFALMGGIPLLIATQTLFGRKPRMGSTISDLGGSLKMAAAGLSTVRQLRSAMPDILRAMSSAAAAWPQASGYPTVTVTGTEATPTTGPPDPGGLVAVLAKLDELHRSGALSDAEYQAAKKQVLGKGQ
jgi:putative oligomerization/nucleic acid binding protein